MDYTFGSRVQSLSLKWPDQGKYMTRRKAIITMADLLDLLTAFPSLRQLEMVCLPFPRLDDLQHGTLASTGALSNLRSLQFINIVSTQRKEEFHTIAIILSLCPLLRHLDLYNIPLDIPTTLSLESPAFALRSFNLKLDRARMINMQTLSWILKNTVEQKSCRRLVVYLGTKMNDLGDFMEDVKEDMGFEGLGATLAPLAVNLAHLDLQGLRKGQTSEILQATTSKLQTLDLHGTFGLSPDLLSDLSHPSSVTSLSFHNQTPVYGGAPILSPEEHVDIPISSTSFMQEVQIGGRLDKLKKITFPANARFQKRGKWFNNSVAKVCRRRNIYVNEVPHTVAVP
jgi:hypothetical protein